MWKYQVTSFLKFVAALVVALCILLPVCLVNVSAFPTISKKEYYLYSPSSQATVSEKISLIELPYIQGECARVETAEGEEYAKTLFEKYGATLLKTEMFDDGVSYYCYSPKLKGGILLERGAFVNLHIVVKETEVVVGTPIVFGGY